MALKRVQSGVPGFDEMIDGGFENGSINLISGGSGAGKTIFALQFLLDGLKKGENVLYVNFEEKKTDFYEDMLQIGWDLEKAEETGRFTFLEYSPEKVKMMLDEGGGTIESIILKNKVTRIAIDSITSFAILFGDEQSQRQAVLSLFNILRGWNCTIILTVQDDPNDKSDKGITPFEFDADSVTTLYNINTGSERERFVEVLKMRGTEHSKDVHVFKIGKRGIQVGPKTRIRRV